jgi:hypothetical protein
VPRVLLELLQVVLPLARELVLLAQLSLHYFDPTHWRLIMPLGKKKTEGKKLSSRGGAAQSATVRPQKSASKKKASKKSVTSTLEASSKKRTRKKDLNKILSKSKIKRTS